MNIDVRLIDAWSLMKVINEDKRKLAEHHNNTHDVGIHNGEYNHFLKRIVEMPEAYNIDDRINDVISEINLLRLSDEGCPYGKDSYRYKFKQEIINDVVNEIEDIIKKGLKL